VVEGIYDRGDKDEVIYCGLKRNQKKQFKRNKKNYERLADHIGTIPLVMISPIDILLIIEGSDGRRKFIDGIISQYDKSYLNNLLNYNKALHHRNLLLKSFWLNRNFDKDSLEIWDEQLIKYGVLIHNSRKTFVDDFTPIFQKYYTQLSNNKETVALIYQSQLNDEKFEDLLINNLAKDKANHYTNFGIHKDDLVFEFDGFPMKKFGSQGQQKTYLMALKLAQAELIKNISEKKVIFLLDDIFDKLDDNRMKQLLAIVSNGDFGQIFITDTSLSRIPDILTEEKINFKAFKIEEGAATDV
jgi:DNA replication and repair protein RecF